MLETMLKKQLEFQKRLGADFTDMSTEERTAFIKEHSIHLNQEINEMLYELPYFKPWKDYSGMSEEAIAVAFAKARMELVDAYHFFMNIMLGLGFTANELYSMYMQKNAENNRRQDDGYTFDKSYREQTLTSCTVTMDGKTTTGDEFVALIDDELFCNVDISDLPIIIKALSVNFVESAKEAPVEIRNIMKVTLGEGLLNKIQEVAEQEVGL